jgi:lactoylglutathione lyase
MTASLLLRDSHSCIYLKSKGVNFVEEPKKMAWGMYAKFVDIDGKEFLLKG